MMCDECTRLEKALADAERGWRAERRQRRAAEAELEVLKRVFGGKGCCSCLKLESIPAKDCCIDHGKRPV